MPQSNAENSRGENSGGGLRHYAGQAVTLGLRPEHILLPSPGDGKDAVCAILERIEPAGAESLFYFSTGGQGFIARVAGDDFPKTQDALPLHFNMEHARFFDPSTGAAIAV